MDAVKRPRWTWVLAVIAVLLVIAALGGGGDADTTAPSRPAATAPPSARAVAAAPAPAPPARASAGCDSNYAGACLDPSSPDYDCQGGSGNGPDYTGPVRVVGGDRFDLDRDGDGLGCE
jgi:hypothetical protein